MALADELDSYMYQTVGHQAIDLYADAMQLPLYRREIEGQALLLSADYQETKDDEVEDLYKLLLQIKAFFTFIMISVFFTNSTGFLKSHSLCGVYRCWFLSVNVHVYCRAWSSSNLFLPKPLPPFQGLLATGLDSSLVFLDCAYV